MKTPNERSRTAWALLALAALCLLVLLPAFGVGSQPLLQGDDAIAQARWQQLYATQFWGGDLYPRWLQDHNEGLGSPAFFLYPPLAHALTALAHPLAPAPEAVQLRLAGSLAVSLIISGVGAFFWFRRLGVSIFAAWLGAAVYVLGPYHLYLDIYQRTAFAEVWAFAWAPFVFLGLHRLRSPGGFAMAALGMAAVLLTHAPSSVLLFPAFAAYALVVGEGPKDTAAKALLFGLAALIAILIAGAYLATALTHGSLIQEHALTAGRLNPTHWLIGLADLRRLLPGDWRTGEGMLRAMMITAAGIQLAIAGLAAFAARRLPEPQSRRALIFAVAMAVVGAVMMTRLSQPLWSLETVLSRIQFPWRILLLLTIASALAVALAADRWLSAGRRLVRLAPPALVLGVLLMANAGFYVADAKMDGWLRLAPTRPERIFASLGEPPEYELGVPDVILPGFDSGRASTAVLSGEGAARTTLWRPRRIALATSAVTQIEVAVRQYDYSGWVYSVDGGGAARSRPMSPEKPVAVIAVPAGEHVISMRLVATTAERVGLWMSALGLLGLALACLGLGARRLKA